MSDRYPHDAEVLADLHLRYLDPPTDDRTEAQIDAEERERARVARSAELIEALVCIVQARELLDATRGEYSLVTDDHAQRIIAEARAIIAAFGPQVEWRQDQFNLVAYRSDRYVGQVLQSDLGGWSWLLAGGEPHGRQNTLVGAKAAVVAALPEVRS